MTTVLYTLNTHTIPTGARPLEGCLSRAAQCIILLRSRQALTSRQLRPQPPRRPQLQLLPGLVAFLIAATRRRLSPIRMCRCRSSSFPPSANSRQHFWEIVMTPPTWTSYRKTKYSKVIRHAMKYRRQPDFGIFFDTTIHSNATTPFEAYGGTGSYFPEYHMNLHTVTEGARFGPRPNCCFFVAVERRLLYMG